MKKTIVIAISGVSGSGKTTIVKNLASQFDCPFLLFDDHTDESTYPENMKAWLEDGANPSLIKTPKFVNSLKSLILENNSPFIFIEEPFGKERDVMFLLIDHTILLDPPLELCLARITKRHINCHSSYSIDSLTSYLDKYINHYRDIYISTANQVRANCDLVIKEVSSIQSTTNYIINFLKTLKN